MICENELNGLLFLIKKLCYVIGVLDVLYNHFDNDLQLYSAATITAHITMAFLSKRQ